MVNPIRIAVLVAVHNRWEMTGKLLSALKAVPTAIQLCLHIVDDGSSDTTATELARLANITYLRRNGSLFWASSMKLAQDSVTDPVDYFLWLNNDVDLAPDFFSRILEAIAKFPSRILVGQTSDPGRHQITYGGMRRVGFHPHRLQIVNAQEKYEVADTFCGNIVLVPYAINSSLGGIDGYFEHGYADYDFGYRAKKMGYQIRIIPGFLGICAKNEFDLSTKNLFETLKLVGSRKYLPIRSQIRFSKRHGGIVWPIYVAYPYLRLILNIKRFRANQRNAGF